MYGLVNRAIESMAIKAGGEEAWQKIKAKAGITDPMFLNMQVYPDQVTYDLVAAASETLGISESDVLRGFGKHWILFTSSQGYGDLLDLTGGDLKTFLSNLNLMHEQVTSSMPELTPPSIEVVELEDQVLEVHYRSKRKGLSDMALGVLEGLIEKFKVEKEVVQTQFADRGQDHDVFEIRQLSGG